MASDEIKRMGRHTQIADAYIAARKPRSAAHALAQAIACAHWAKHADHRLESDAAFLEHIEQLQQDMIVLARGEVPSTERKVACLPKKASASAQAPPSKQHVPTTGASGGTPATRMSDGVNTVEPPRGDDGQYVPSKDAMDRIGGYASQKLALSNAMSMAFDSRATEMIEPGEVGSLMVMIHGPPGTGKTSLAVAAALAQGVPAVILRPSDILNKYVGGTSENVRAIFSAAVHLAPCVLILDECESFFAARSDSASDSGSLSSAKSQFLQELDAVMTGKDRVGFIGITNDLKWIDDAFQRRLSRVIHMPEPGPTGRAEILRVLLGRLLPRMHAVDCNAVAARLKGATGANIGSMIEKARTTLVVNLLAAEYAVEVPCRGEGDGRRCYRPCTAATHGAVRGATLTPATDRFEDLTTEDLMALIPQPVASATPPPPHHAAATPVEPANRDASEADGSEPEASDHGAPDDDVGNEDEEDDDDETSTNEAFV